VREIAGIGMGQKLPREPIANAQANAAPKVLETKPGPPPVLTKRGADVLVRVEKLLDDAAKAAAKSAATDPRQARPASSTSALAFPQNYAEENANASAPRKN
jgi:penicillin-binding protein 1A